MSGLIDADTLAAAIRISAPIMLVALGVSFSFQAKIFNIAVEGFMLSGAFFAILAVDRLGNTWFGLLGGVVAGMVLSALYAAVVVRFGANDIIASIAINLMALGFTSFLVKPLFGTEGGYRPPNMEILPSINIPLIERVPFLGPALSGHTPVVYMTFLIVIASYLLLFKTPFGLAVRCVGENTDAARTAGLSPDRTKWLVILLSGALSGLAGAHLATGYVSEFTENMTQGRGFTAFTASVFGAFHPVFGSLASLVFGFADALGFRLQLEGLGLPPSILKMFPYLLGVLVLTLSAALRKQREASTG